MGFKDKLFGNKTSKLGKKFGKKIDQLDDKLEDAAGAAHAKLGHGFEHNMSAEHDIDAVTDDLIDDIVSDDGFGDALFDDAKPDSISANTTGFSPVQRTKHGNTKTKMYIISALLIICGLAALLYYFYSTMGQNNNPNQNSAQPKTPASTVKPNTPVAQPSPAAAQPKLLPEKIDRPLPESKTVAAEELDALGDERARLDEQEKMLEEQLKTAEKLSELKAQKIALLEKQIAEAQKAQQQGAQATPAQAAEATKAEAAKAQPAK